jgi:hypothetical protein
MRILAIGLLLFTGLLWAQPKPAAYLRGTVVDPNQGVMPNVTVRVASETTSCTEKTNERGEFNCAVLPGRYKVSITETPIGYQRAGIDVSLGSHTFLTLRIVFTAGALALYVDHDELLPPAYKVQNQTLLLNDVEAMVRYVSKVEQPGETTFAGPELMLTAEDLTVYGDHIYCTNPVSSCTVYGKVTVELGQQRLEGTKLFLDLTTRKFTLTRDPEVTNTF